MVPEWLIIDFIPKIEILENFFLFQNQAHKKLFYFPSFLKILTFLILRILNWNRPGKAMGLFFQNFQYLSTSSNGFSAFSA